MTKYLNLEQNLESSNDTKIASQKAVQVGVEDVDHIKNSNTSSGAITDLKVWQGTSDEFQNQTANLYAWSKLDPKDYNKDIENTVGLTNGYATSNENFVAFASLSGGFILKKDNTAITSYGYNYFADGNTIVRLYNNTECDISSSTDGETWTTCGSTLTCAAKPKCGACLKGKWYIFSCTTSGTESEYYYSDDKGVTWTTGTVPKINIMNAKVVGDKMFIHNNNSSGGYTYVTSDGINWNEISYGSRLYVDFYKDGVYYGHTPNQSYNTNVWTSTDGINWAQDETKKIMIAGNGFVQNLDYVNGYYLNISSSSVYYSTDMIDWKSFTLKNYSMVWSFNTFGNDIITAPRSNTTVTFFNILDTIYTLSSTPSVGDKVRNKYGKISNVGTDEITINNYKTYVRNTSKDGNKTLNANLKYKNALCIIEDVAYVRDDSIKTLNDHITSEDETEIIKNGTLYGIPLPSGKVFSTETGEKHLEKYDIDGVYLAKKYATVSSSAINELISLNSSTMLAFDAINCYKSTDSGSTWTQLSVVWSEATSSKTLQATNGNIYAWRSNGSTTSVYLYISTDNGETWSKYTCSGSGTDKVTNYVMYYDGTTFMWGVGGTKYYTSTDGYTWTSTTVTDSRGYVASTDSLSIGLYNNVMTKSTDHMITWTTETFPYSATDPLNHFYLNNQFIYITKTKIYTSSDGTTWTENDYNIDTYTGNITRALYYNNIYYLMSSYSDVLYSSDLKNFKLLVKNNYNTNVTIINHAYKVYFAVGGNVYNTTSAQALIQDNYLIPSTNFSSSATQTLKNVNGVIQWVTDA